MSGDANIPPASFFLWLGRHAGFPGARLKERAELLLLIGGLVQEEHLPERSDTGALQLIPGSPDFENAQRSSQRALAELRRRVHFKCDNGAKV